MKRIKDHQRFGMSTGLTERKGRKPDATRSGASYDPNSETLIQVGKGSRIRVIGGRVEVIEGETKILSRA